MRVSVRMAGGRLLVLLALAAGAISARHLICHQRAPRTQAVGVLPLSFERNDGQLEAGARFFARQTAADIFLTEDGLLVALKSAPAAPPQRASRARGDVLRLRWIGGRATEIAGLSELPGRASYFRGADPAGWRAGIPTFAKVKYSGIY